MKRAWIIIGLLWGISSVAIALLSRPLTADSRLIYDRLLVKGYPSSESGQLLERLRQVEGLGLGYEVETLPPEIAHLTNLQRLDLRYTQITELPPEIGHLSNLEELVLSYLALAELPSEIGQLQNLQALDLSYSSIRALPPEVGRLTNIAYLDLTQTSITQLPPQISQLTNLRGLDLRYTHISELPPGLEDSPRLTLYLEGTALAQADTNAP